MVSLQKALAPESPRTEVHTEFEASSKKRKWGEPFAEEFLKDHQTSSETKEKPVFDIELNLDTPFTADKWRQFLSIQSGQIHLCNTRVDNSTAEDSWRNPEPPPPPPPHHMSLDLDLNLTCHDVNVKQNSGSTGSLGEHDHDLLFNEVPSKCKKDSHDHQALTSEGDHKEMVATVCMRCHMLVMLCKSSPACPNCKFMHPPDQNPSTFLKRRCSLFC